MAIGYARIARWSSKDRLAEFAPGQPPEAALTVMAPLRFAAWGVVIQQRNAQAFSGLNTTSRGLLFTGLVLVVMGVLMARTLSRSVVAPIRQLSRQAEAMRAGDLSSAIAVSGDHEIAVLAKTLDEARAGWRPRSANCRRSTSASKNRWPLAPR